MIARATLTSLTGPLPRTSWASMTIDGCASVASASH
jgi:hypothetical protein